MKLAAIDVGSNAIRLQIVRVFDENDLVSFKKLEFLRFPLRLGHDVFKKGKITKPTLRKFTKLMQTFQILVDLYEVDGLNAVATSAMREAENSKAVLKQIRRESNLKLNLISGEEEARILYKAIIPYIGHGSYLHIDVGGGSTELNYFENRSIKESQSFNVGAVRQLTRKQRVKIFSEVEQWIRDLKLNKKKNMIGIGTGGNINKMYKLANKANNNTLSLAELKALRAYVNEFSFDERMSILKMNPDRADVIVPASEIYIRILHTIHSDQIMVPQVGLKDGLIYELYERVSEKSLSQIEFLEEF